jgi:hypothetical protein
MLDLKVASLECDETSSTLCLFHVDGTGGLFVPNNQEIVVNRSQQLAPPGKCPIHDTSMEFWCYTDEVLLCEACRIYCHLGHDVVKIVDRNKEELASFYDAADEAVELVSEMKKTCLDIKKQSERVKCEYDALVKLVNKCIRKNCNLKTFYFIHIYILFFNR